MKVEGRSVEIPTTRFLRTKCLLMNPFVNARPALSQIDSSPSSQDGISLELEDSLRSHGTNLIQSCGILLKLLLPRFFSALLTGQTTKHNSDCHGPLPPVLLRSKFQTTCSQSCSPPHILSSTDPQGHCNSVPFPSLKTP